MKEWDADLTPGVEYLVLHEKGVAGRIGTRNDLPQTGGVEEGDFLQSWVPKGRGWIWCRQGLCLVEKIESLTLYQVVSTYKLVQWYSVLELKEHR